MFETGNMKMLKLFRTKKYQILGQETIYIYIYIYIYTHFLSTSVDHI